MRIGLIVADSRRSAPAEDGNSKNGQPFALCAVSRQTWSPIIGNGMPMARNRAKRKTSEGQRVRQPLLPTQSDSVSQLEEG